MTLLLTHNPALLADALRDAIELADRHAVAVIEQHGHEAGRAPNGRLIWDLRPMLDRSKQCADALQMAEQAVRYARARGLIQVADRNRDVVVITRLDA